MTTNGQVTTIITDPRATLRLYDVRDGRTSLRSCRLSARTVSERPLAGLSESGRWTGLCSFGFSPT